MPMPPGVRGTSAAMSSAAVTALDVASGSGTLSAENGATALGSLGLMLMAAVRLVGEEVVLEEVEGHERGERFLGKRVEERADDRCGAVAGGDGEKDCEGGDRDQRDGEHSERGEAECERVGGGDAAVREV